MILSPLSTISGTIQAGTLDQSHTFHFLQILEIIVRKLPVRVDPCPPTDTEWTRGALGAGHHATILFDSSHQGTTKERAVRACELEARLRRASLMLAGRHSCMWVHCIFTKSRI